MDTIVAISAANALPQISYANTAVDDSERDLRYALEDYLAAVCQYAANNSFTIASIAASRETDDLFDGFIVTLQLPTSDGQFAMQCWEGIDNYVQEGYGEADEPIGRIISDRIATNVRWDTTGDAS
jgi:hypothetical protein